MSWLAPLWEGRVLWLILGGALLVAAIRGVVAWKTDDPGE